jgi:hypothetical protein
MGSPVSGTLAEIYLQFFEELIVKHWMEICEITFYRRYVDDIFRTCNTRYNQLCDRIPLNKINSSGIHILQCKTCNKSYVGQTGRLIEIRHRECIRCIKTNNPISAYALHNLNNRHEYRSPEQTMHFLKKHAVRERK